MSFANYLPGLRSPVGTALSAAMYHKLRNRRLRLGTVRERVKILRTMLVMYNSATTEPCCANFVSRSLHPLISVYASENSPSASEVPPVSEVAHLTGAPDSLATAPEIATWR